MNHDTGDHDKVYYIIQMATYALFGAERVLDTSGVVGSNINFHPQIMTFLLHIQACTA